MMYLCAKMKVRYRLVYCRKRVFRGDGRALVQVEASQGGRKKYFGTNIYLLPQEWDRRREQVVRHPNADALNAYLFEMVVNMERVELDLWKRGVSPTLELIKEGMSGEGEPEMSFCSFAQKAVVDSTRSDATKKNLMRTLECLSECRPGFSWVDMNHSFVQYFEMWLGSHGFARNTVVKHLRNFRTLVGEAIACGLIKPDDNPFMNFRIFVQRGRHKFLSPEELRRLEELQVDGRLGHVRDAFVFCCYTGLRFSDFCRLREDVFVQEDGCEWIRMCMKKTGTEVAVPVGLLFEGKGMAVLRRYRSVEVFAKVGSNSRVNLALKQLQAMAGVNAHMTFHLARHTCATLLCYQGVPITTIQRVLGHANIGTTQIYQEVMNETMVKDLKGARRL